MGCLGFLGRLGRSDRLEPDPSSISPAAALHWLQARQTAHTDPTRSVDAAPPQVAGAPGGAVGLQGRPGKAADTCYAWWVVAGLRMLGSAGAVAALPAADEERVRAHLLGQTQHALLGGFCKFPGDHPDMHHSYLGLAALGLMGGQEEGVRAVDAMMCISVEARGRLEGIWRGWGEGIN